MRVSDVLSSKGSAEVYTVRPDATLIEFLDKLAELNVGALVVSDDGERVIGIVSERDVVRKFRSFADAENTTVESIMTAEVLVCEPGDSIESLMAMITEHRVRHVPVLVDGALVGILSIGDAVKFRMDQLEFERDQLNNYVAGR
ncbi:CBS domain-containing protein [Aeromicrobium sp.]